MYSLLIMTLYIQVRSREFPAWLELTGLDKKNVLAYNCRDFLTHQKNMCLGAKKNRLIETVLLSTKNICFGSEIRKLFLWYALLTKGLLSLRT